jgi:hypothetical protein
LIPAIGAHEIEKREIHSLTEDTDPQKSCIYIVGTFGLSRANLCCLGGKPISKWWSI